MRVAPLLLSPPLAALVLSPLAVAGDDWSSLDDEIERLEQQSSGLRSDLHLRGFVQSVFFTSNDRQPGLGSRTHDFQMRATRLVLEGRRGETSFCVEEDFSTGAPVLMDAWIRFPWHSTSITVGQARAPVARSASQHLADLFFLDRTHIGRLFQTHRAGLQASGQQDRLHWQVAAQDGADAAGDGLLLAVRASGRIGDTASPDLVQGAWDAGESATADLALSWYDDDGVQDATGMLLEVRAQGRRWSAGLETLDLGRGLPTANGTPFRVIAGIAQAQLVPDTTPWALHGTWQLAEQRVELGARLQQYDNPDDERQIDLAAVHYFDGPALRWTLQFSTTDSRTFGESAMGLLGLSLSF